MWLSIIEMDSESEQGQRGNKREDYSDRDGDLFNDSDEDKSFRRLQRKKPRNDSSSKQKKISKDKSHVHKGELKNRKRIKMNKVQRSMDNKKEQQLDELCKLRAEDILRQMKSKADHDIRKIMAGQGSTSKLEYVGTIAKDLETRATAEYFLQGDGLGMFERWLRKYADGTEPSYALKKGCFEILFSLPVGPEHVSKCQSLLTLIQKHQSCNHKDLKQLAESLTFKWDCMLADNYDDEERD